MKKLLPLFLLLFCLQTAYGQKIRFTDTSNEWTVTYKWPVGVNVYGYRTSHPHYMGDTILNGKQYRILTDLGIYPIAKTYVRDDTVTNKVYSFITDETLLYDYNLNVGDTFRFRQLISSGIYDDHVHFVVAVDTILINGIKHQIWNFMPLTASDGLQYYVIEGVGSNYGTHFPFQPTDPPKQELLCFKHNGNILSLTNPFTNQIIVDGSTCALSVENTIKQIQSTTVSPNPANEHSKITFPYTIQSGSLYITNMLGQVVIQRSIINSGQVYIGNGINAEGVYFYKIADNQTGNNFTGRFVYQ